MNICCYGWFNKQADWPIGEQDKVKWERQTGDDGMKKGRVRGVASQAENELDIQNGIEVKVTSLRASHRLTEMG